MGDAVNVCAVTLSVHTGTHADAPYHFSDSGATIDEIGLDPYVGPAVVLDMRGKELIRREDVDGCDFSYTPRVLFKTDAWTDYTRFPTQIPVLAPDVPAYLAARGVILVGLDVPSVDPIDSEDLPNHHALAAHGIHILESLCLADVPSGEYELIALPLKLVGADGAPIRAILRR